MRRNKQQNIEMQNMINIDTQYQQSSNTQNSNKFRYEFTATTKVDEKLNIRTVGDNLFDYGNSQKKNWVFDKTVENKIYIKVNDEYLYKNHDIYNMHSYIKTITEIAMYVQQEQQQLPQQEQQQLPQQQQQLPQQQQQLPQ